MLSILPYERTDRDSDRPFKSYPRVPVSVPSSQAPFYGHYSASAFVGRHPSTSHRGALDLSGMDLRHGMPPLDGPSHMGGGGHDMSQQRDHVNGHHMGSAPQMSVYQQHHNPPSAPDHYLGRAGQPAPLPQHPVHMPTSDPLHGATTPPLAPSAHSPANDSSNSSNDQTTIKIPPKKRPLTVPDEQKDNCYWEKRKKNNESAKRSRDARRLKEEQISMRVVYLEQENLQLRTEVSLLKSEIEKLRCMLYNS